MQYFIVYYIIELICHWPLATGQEDKGEARMDIIDSEIGYLGYHESESYGLVWKVSAVNRLIASSSTLTVRSTLTLVHRD